MDFKSKNVLFCGEMSESSRVIIKVLLGHNLKSLQISNGIEDSIEQIGLVDSRLSHCVGNLSKIEDLEVIYTEALKRCKKKLHVVVNHKELGSSDAWEEVITSQINSIICSTLMAIKHMGSMNGGGGGVVVNSIAVRGRTADEYASVHRLLSDLDRSFSDPYYFNNTAVRMLTMCTCMEIGEGCEPSEAAAAAAVAEAPAEAGSSAAQPNPTGHAASVLTKKFREVCANKRSSLDPVEKPMEEFEISVRS